MANAFEKKDTTKTKKKSGKQLRVPPLPIPTIAKILSIVDAVKNGAKINGVVDAAKADKAMQIKIGSACLLGVITDYAGSSRIFTVKVCFGEDILQYTVSTTGNRDIDYLIASGAEGEAARGYDTTYISRLKALVETGSLVPCLSYIQQVREKSFDISGAFFRKEFSSFKKLFGADKLTELEELMEKEPTFRFNYQDCEDALKYINYLQDIIANTDGKYAPDFVKLAQDKLTEINTLKTFTAEKKSASTKAKKSASKVEINQEIIADNNADEVKVDKDEEEELQQELDAIFKTA